MIIDEARSKGEDPTTLVTNKDIPTLFKGLDEVTDDFMDKAILASDSLFKAVLKNVDHSARLYNFLYQ